MVEEEIAFNRAVDAVVSWVEANSDWGETLVIVTSDHETGYLTGPGSGVNADGPTWNPMVDNGVGVPPGMEFNFPAEDGQFVHTNSLAQRGCSSSGSTAPIRSGVRTSTTRISARSSWRRSEDARVALGRRALPT
jgi:alkaline phosphatase